MSIANQVNDQHWMARALALAARGRYSTAPNPRVGCVIVRAGQVVGEGWHRQAGGPHAEVHALRQAGEAARGATAYVTLEPCSHHGRTPPCADALVAAGVAEVVAAMTDPNPLVAGRGLARLAAAGIATRAGVLEAEARALNAGFIQRMLTGRPFVRVKLALSLDGRTAMANGESQWITGPMARQSVQRLRAEAGVVITGADTVLADGARLTVRPNELGLTGEELELATLRTPQRLLIDGRGRVPLDAPFFQAGAARVAGMAAEAPTYAAAGHDYLSLPGINGQVDLAALLTRLGSEQVNDVLVEAGPRLAGAFAQASLVDEYHLFLAPKFLGSSARPLLDWPLEHLAQAPQLEILSAMPVGVDLHLIARPQRDA